MVSYLNAPSQHLFMAVKEALAQEAKTVQEALNFSYLPGIRFETGHRITHVGPLRARPEPDKSLHEQDSCCFPEACGD